MFTTSCRIFAIIHPHLLNSLGLAEAQHIHLTVVQQRSGKSDEKKNVLGLKISYLMTQKSTLLASYCICYICFLFCLYFFSLQKNQQNKLHSFLHTIKHKKTNKPSIILQYISSCIMHKINDNKCFFDIPYFRE